MAWADKEMVVGLDVGASGITVAVYSPVTGAGQELAGVGFSPALGFEKGIVVNMDDAVGSVRRAVADAELASGVNISFVYICSDMPDMLVKRGSEKHVLNGREISRRELLEAQNQTFNNSLPDGYSVAQIAAVQYYVDGKPTASPLAVRGRELKIEADIVAAHGGKMEELYRCFAEAGLKVKQFVAGPLAAAEAVLDGMERELGVVLVDIGAGMTKTAYINHGTIDKLSVFPVGSGHITSDLALVLHTTLEEAEIIKTSYGLKPVEKSLTVQPVSGAGGRSVPGDLAQSVIRYRVEEIFEFVNKFITSLKITADLPGGIVITGGGALLTGLPEMAGKHLGIPVRIGSSRLLMPDNVPEQKAYQYTNAVGLSLWAARRTPVHRGVKGRLGGGIVNRIRDWLQ